MDLNMWEMWRENARRSHEGTVLDVKGATLISLPAGLQFHNCILLRDDVDFKDLLETAALFYGERNSRFSVWIRAHADGSCENQLLARDYGHMVTLPAMAMISDPGTRREPTDFEIRAVADTDAVADFIEVCSESYAVYGQPAEVAATLFVGVASLRAAHLQGFVGYHQGRPTAIAVVYVSHAVAGINWVGSTPESRGKGHAEAVVWAALREGFSRGADVASLQASPMGFGLYRRMGFITPSEYRIYVPGS